MRMRSRPFVFILTPLLTLLLGLFWLPQNVAAQAEIDYPLPAAPNIRAASAPEPLVFIGDYCGAFGGVSLHDTDGGPGAFTVNVTGEPVEAFIVWSGRNRQGSPGDDNLEVSINGGMFMPIVADQALLANSEAGFSWFTYSYDALAGGVPVQSGANEFVFRGLEDGGGSFEAHGVGVLILGEDPLACPFQAFGLFFGNDVFYHGWDGSSGPNSELVCIDFPALPDPLEMDLQMFVGGVENPYRANAIWALTGSSDTKPLSLVSDPDAVELRMALRGLQGDEFDNYDTVVQDPNPILVDAGDTWACVQIESPPEVNNERFPPIIIDGQELPLAKRQGLSATWITQAMRVPLAEIEISPDGVNPVGQPHTFDITVNSALGFAGSLVITPSVTPAPDTLSHTCDSPVITGGMATCTLTINSDVAGVFTASAEAVVGIGNGLTAYLSTSVDRESQGPAVKEYVVVPTPAIDIEKATNGEDADLPKGPEIGIGEPVFWTYEVTNTGNVVLTGVAVVDNQGVAVTCPQDTLQPGESMLCTGEGVAELGQYANIGSVTGISPEGETVRDEDPSHYIGVEPSAIDDPDAPDNPATRQQIFLPAVRM
jgi:hypothetical protein